MLVRTLTPDDAPAYVALRREMLLDSPWAFAASPGDDVGLDAGHIAREVSRAGYAIAGAFNGPGLIGAVGIHRPRHAKLAHRAHVWGAYVTPSARGSGVGASVLARALDVAASWPGVTSAGLSVSESSPAAQRLYERLGFRAWGREPGALVLSGRSFDEIHMVINLPRR